MAAVARVTAEALVGAHQLTVYGCAHALPTPQGTQDVRPTMYSQRAALRFFLSGTDC
jgi:hypothetical protein